MNPTTNTVIYNPSILEKRLLTGLISTCFILLCMYVFFVNQTVWNVAARQDTFNKINSFSGEIAALETEFMNKSASLTLERAYTMGFQEASSKEVVFINKIIPSVALR